MGNHTVSILSFWESNDSFKYSRVSIRIEERLDRRKGRGQVRHFVIYDIVVSNDWIFIKTKRYFLFGSET